MPVEGHAYLCPAAFGQHRLGCIAAGRTYGFGSRGCPEGSVLRLSLNVNHKAYQLLPLAPALYHRHKRHLDASALALRNHVDLQLRHFGHVVAGNLQAALYVAAAHLVKFGIFNLYRIYRVGPCAAERQRTGKARQHAVYLNLVGSEVKKLLHTAAHDVAAAEQRDNRQ